jgi:hypothetical protein
VSSKPGLSLSADGCSFGLQVAVLIWDPDQRWGVKLEPLV